ncbi:hypothetical protein J7U46_08160 [Pelomonas sp. V22]|uniref:hypothetical protein n=1 Tax=Pelomonas sp. V22 TaxID=2822139 RepID=UPI0024A8960B|nr:hypothetical protein [Pelomonas sp. V22]MDI4633021.1 hypothetical protein [Pelomonas sp. V22]
MMKRLLLTLPLLAGLVACEQLGIEDPAKIAAAKEAEGKAVGSACRHASRAIEDCYLLNPKALKAAVFAGWKEMDEYMRENKLEGVTPVVPRGPDGKALPPPDPAASADAEGKAEAKPGKDAGKEAKAKASH